MKTMPSQLIFFLQNRTVKRNFVALWKFLAFLAAIIILYSVLFHVLMVYEGRYYSWITGLYWTMTVMSTLGFGDITFHTDVGLLFTMLVLLSGVLFMLIILPFTFIQFFYAPWLEAQERARTPRELPEDVRDHVIITHIDPVTTRLIERLINHNIAYVFVTSDVHQANSLQDQGYRVVIGEPDRPETYERLRIDKAAIVVVTNDDLISTNILFTIRETNKDVPIVTNADHEHSIDILEFAGNTSVFQFMKMLGESVSKRSFSLGRTTNVIGRFDDLIISEMPAMNTDLAGKTLAELGIRQNTGATVIGLMEKGKFKASTPQTVITPQTILIVAGATQQLKKFDSIFTVKQIQEPETVQVLILGGGRVGMAAAKTLDEYGISYRIIEKRAVRAKSASIKDSYIIGDAADINTLEAAGLKSAKSVIITTHSDDINIYLAFYCRQLRPDIQIISRSTFERNVLKLHTAGADLVMSYASLGAGIIFRLIRPNEISLFTEDLVVINKVAGTHLAGKSIITSKIREKTGCSIIAIRRGENLIISPDPNITVNQSDELIIIGTAGKEQLVNDL
jgi:Trk K+ transport system NAD-binding subunit